jgi:hypothetical protein
MTIDEILEQAKMLFDLNVIDQDQMNQYMDLLDYSRSQTRGYLNLNKSDVRLLPDNLIVYGDLYLIESEIVELPSNLRVKGDLFLDKTKITEIPDDLIVDGNLWLMEMPNLDKEKISPNIQIGGEINF